MISLTLPEFEELRQQSLRQSQVYEHCNGFDRVEKQEHQFAKEQYETILFRPELRLEIIDDFYYQNYSIAVDHSEFDLLVSKFYLSGCHRVLTPNVPDVSDDYIERADYNYLFFLPDIQETEQFFANQRSHLIRIEVDPNLLIFSDSENSQLPPILQQLFEGNLNHRFHQTVGKINSAMQLTLRQILNCPYAGAMKRMYLESKVLELLTLQFNQWSAHYAAQSNYNSRPLLPDDVERLHHAKEVLVQNFNNPPSLLDLARQVGLNDYKLKQGFRQVFGTTVFGYLNAYRMKQAQQLLAEQTLSVAGVAQRVGYTSQSRFCDAFKRQFGVSPRAYRTRLRE